MLRGALAGAVAGLIASWVMESFEAAWTQAGKQIQKQHAFSRPAEEPATVRVASAVAEPVLERELTAEEKPIAGEVVHYGFGTFSGALYGAVSDVLPPLRAFNGMLFGAGLWIVADELMLWKLGLAKKPTGFPTATHAYALASHLVYGLMLEAVRRLVRRLV